MAKRKKRVKHAEVVQLFASKLRELRHSRGYTQAELARRASVTTSYIGRLEGGGAAPGIDLLARLSEALGVAVTDLLPLAPPDPLAVLKDQARTLFDSLLEATDRERLLLLVPLLRLLLAAKKE